MMVSKFPAYGPWNSQSVISANKCQPAVCRLRFGESVHGPQALVARDIGEVRLQFAVDAKLRR